MAGAVATGPVENTVDVDSDGAAIVVTSVVPITGAQAVRSAIMATTAQRGQVVAIMHDVPATLHNGTSILADHGCMSIVATLIPSVVRSALASTAFLIMALFTISVSVSLCNRVIFGDSGLAYLVALKRPHYTREGGPLLT